MSLIQTCRFAVAGVAALGVGAKGVQIARRRTTQALEEKKYEAKTQVCRPIDEVLGCKKGEGLNSSKSE
jgi:hypothetical protein